MTALSCATAPPFAPGAASRARAVRARPSSPAMVAGAVSCALHAGSY